MAKVSLQQHGFAYLHSNSTDNQKTKLVKHRNEKLNNLPGRTDIESIHGICIYTDRAGKEKRTTR